MKFTKLFALILALAVLLCACGGPAEAPAEEIPEVMLEGLPYSEFKTPVVLFSEGRGIDCYRVSCGIRRVYDSSGTGT